MAAMSISAVLVMLVATVVAIRDSKSLALLKQFHTFRVLFASVALAAACVWSLIWADVTNLEFFGASPQIKFLSDSAKLWHLFFPFFLIVLLSKMSDRHFRAIVVIWLGTGIFISIFAFIQHYVPIFKPSMLAYINYPNYERGAGFWNQISGTYHATGFTGSHLSFASIIAFPFACWLTLASLSFRKKRRNAWSIGNFSVPLRPLTAVGATLTFGAVFLTFSKMAWVSGPLTVVLITVMGFKGRMRIGIIALLVLLTALWTTTSEFQFRFQGIQSIINERMELWKANWAMVKEHPLFGVGWHHNFELSYAYYKSVGVKHGFSSHAHNNILDQWSTTGIFGVIAFVFLNYLLLKMAFQVYNARFSVRTDDIIPRALGLGFFAGWICLHLNGVTQANFWDAKVLHQIGWVTAVTLEILRRSRAVNA